MTRKPHTGHPAAAPVAAIFDFDGTLIAGYSIAAFLRERWRRGELGVGAASRTALMMLEAAAGAADQHELIERGLAEWRGCRARELERLGEQLFEGQLADAVFPEMRAAVEEHRRAGHSLVIATSATQFQVGPVARSLGIDTVLCTRLESRRGVLTGRAAGPILWGPRKAAAVREFAAARGIDLARSYFYADGDEDEALMHLVGHPRPVNPAPQLERVALRRGWPVRRLASRGRPGAGAVLRSLAATATAVPVFAGAAALQWLTGSKRDAANFAAGTLTDVVLALGKVRLEVQGEEHLWSHRPAVFVWNHRNVFDAQIVGKLVRRDFGAVAKRELARVPLFAAASHLMHIAFVDRSDTQAAITALEPATRLLGEGISMLVAPEGRRVAGGGIGEFKKGAFRMAMQAGVPVVPIVIRNADVVGPRDGSVPRPATVQVAVLPPVPVHDWTLAELDARIAAVRQSFVDTLADWPDCTAGRRRSGAHAQR